MTVSLLPRRLDCLLFAVLVSFLTYYPGLADDEVCDSPSETSTNTCTASYSPALEKLEEFDLSILPEGQLTLRLMQQSSFVWNGYSDQIPDDTGMAVWGTSVCLGRYLAQEGLPTILHDFSQSDRDSLTILELGSGATGIPSLVSCRFAHQNQTQLETKAVRLIASDQEERALKALKHAACLNECSNLEVRELPWGRNATSIDEQEELQADIILASGVMYNRKMVDPLVETVRKHLKPSGRAYFTLPKDNPGVHVFTHVAMKEAGFCLIEQKGCKPYQDSYQEKHDKDISNDEGLPPGFQNEGASRWQEIGANNLFVFESIQESSCMEQFSLSILPRGQLTLRVKQQSSFDWSERLKQAEADDTGMVVWGASVCLGRYLAQEIIPAALAAASKSGESLTILELGCGTGIPSLVACNLANSYQTEMNNRVRVIASDQSERTLQHVGDMASLNGCSYLELQSLPWGTDNYNRTDKTTAGGQKEVQADILLASEVIYSHESVAILVETIDRYLKPNGKAYIALRTDRVGVDTFTGKAMQQAGFRLLESIGCELYQDDYQEEHEKDVLNHEDMPPGFQYYRQFRWWGPNELYVYERLPG